MTLADLCLAAISEPHVLAPLACRRKVAREGVLEPAPFERPSPDRGRIGIYELISVTPAISALIHQGGSEQALLSEARKASHSLFQDGRQRVIDGLTSLDELLRVTRED